MAEKKTRGRANGEGSIFLRKRDNKYVAELITGWTPDGKKKVLRQACETREAAHKWLTEQLGMKHKDQLVEPSKERVTEFFARWMDDNIIGVKKPATALIYGKMIDKHITPEIGRLLVQDVKPVAISSLLAKKRREGKARATISLIFTILTQAFGWAERMGLVLTSPMAKLRQQDMLPSAPKKEVQFLGPAEIERFLAAASTHRLHPLFVVLLGTGMRIGEACGLRWADVKWSTNEIAVTQGLVSLDNKVEIGTPKSKSSIGSIPVDAGVMDALRKWDVAQGEERRAAGADWEHPELVFTTSRGTFLKPIYIRNSLLPMILRRAGMRRITPHVLRHSYASYMSYLGVSLPAISKLLRHSSVSITSNIYTHATSGELREAATKLGEAMAARKQA